MIQTTPTLFGGHDSPRIASGSRTANIALSQAMNRRIFALRRRFDRGVSSLRGNFSKKSAGRLGTATGVELHEAGFGEPGLSGGATIRGGGAGRAGFI